jgi:predicted nucleotidyltransferase
VLLFGSVARGEIREWTDLDLVVVADTDLPFYERTRRILNSVQPKVGMDVIVYTPVEWDELKHTRSFVKQEIIHKGRVVYERES